MKVKFLLFACILVSSTCFAQALMSHLTSLRTSEAGFAVAEITLAYRSGLKQENIQVLGSQGITIPEKQNGTLFTIAYNRFGLREGMPFEMDDAFYLPVHLSYDMETIDPRDDVFIYTFLFPIDAELAQDHLQRFSHLPLTSADFQKAPKGKSTSEINIRDYNSNK